VSRESEVTDKIVGCGGVSGKKIEILLKKERKVIPKETKAKRNGSSV
jgi:hypothetical protein